MYTRSDMSCEISVDNVSDNFDKNCYDLLIPREMLQLKILKPLAKVNLMNFMRIVCVNLNVITFIINGIIVIVCGNSILC